MVPAEKSGSRMISVQRSGLINLRFCDTGLRNRLSHSLPSMGRLQVKYSRASG